MRAGDTALAKWTETASAVFTVSAGPALTVKRPTGASDAPVLPTIAPGTAATVQTLSKEVVWTEAGEYELYWAMDTSLEGPFTRLDRRFVGFNDLHSMVRAFMRRTAAVVPDEDINPVLVYIVRGLVDKYDCIDPYRWIPAADQYWIDTAIAYFAAAKLESMPSLNMQVPAGVKSLRQRGIQYTFGNATGLPGSTELNRQRVGDGYQALMMVSCLKTLLGEPWAGVDMFAAAGPRRAMRAGGADTFSEWFQYLAGGIGISIPRVR